MDNAQFQALIAIALREARREGMMEAVRAAQSPPGATVAVPSEAEAVSYAYGYAHGRRDAAEAIERAATTESPAK